MTRLALVRESPSGDIVYDDAVLHSERADLLRRRHGRLGKEIPEISAAFVFAAIVVAFFAIHERARVEGFLIIACLLFAWEIGATLIAYRTFRSLRRSPALTDWCLADMPMVELVAILAHPFHTAAHTVRIALSLLLFLLLYKAPGMVPIAATILGAGAFVFYRRRRIAGADWCLTNSQLYFMFPTKPATDSEPGDRIPYRRVFFAALIGTLLWFGYWKLPGLPQIVLLPTLLATAAFVAIAGGRQLRTLRIGDVLNPRFHRPHESVEAYLRAWAAGEE